MFCLRRVLNAYFRRDRLSLWRVDNFRVFLEARKALLAAEVNRRLEELLHGETRWLAGPTVPARAPTAIAGGITSEEEELESLNDWVEEMGLPHGVLAYDFADPDTGEQQAVFDLAWPNGIQEELSQPVAVLLNEGAEVIAIASQAGYRCFMTVPDFKHYVETEILAQEAAA